MLLILKSAFPALFLWLLSVSPVPAQETFATGQITIVTAAGARHVLAVEIADTPDQRAQGLMNRTEMPPDQGMLFDFAGSREVMMWMKNTPLSLDMLFIDEAGRIRHIAERTEPFSERIIGSGGPVRYVIEVNGGRADALGIRPGDQLVMKDGMPVVE